MDGIYFDILNEINLLSFSVLLKKIYCICEKSSAAKYSWQQNGGVDPHALFKGLVLGRKQSSMPFYFFILPGTMTFSNTYDHIFIYLFT